MYLDQSCQLYLLSDALAVPRCRSCTCVWSSEAATDPGWEGPTNCPTCWPGCLTSQPWSAYIRPLPQLYSWPPTPPPPAWLIGQIWIFETCLPEGERDILPLKSFTLFPREYWMIYRGPSGHSLALYNYSILIALPLSCRTGPYCHVNSNIYAFLITKRGLTI